MDLFLGFVLLPTIKQRHEFLWALWDGYVIPLPPHAFPPMLIDITLCL